MANRIKFDLKKVKRLASLGLTQSEIAMSLGVGTRTVEDRIANDTDFTDAYTQGKYSGLADVSNALFDEAMSGNVQAQKFFLAARHGLSDKVDITSNGATLAPTMINIVRPEDVK
jgi:hypothetical protein